MDHYDDAPLWWLEAQSPTDPEKIRRLRAAIAAARQREEGGGGQPYGLHGAVDPVMKQIGEDIERRVEAVQERLDYHYAVVDEDQLTEETREAAADALKAFPPLWPMSLVWFRPESREERERLKELGLDGALEGFSDSDDILGWTKKCSDEVYLRADCSPADTARTLLHELRHTVQPAGMSAEERETDARCFAEQAAAELGY